MRALSFVSLALAGIALASPVKFDGLAVEITGPQSVNSVKDLKFTATVKNAGSEAVKLLNYATILDNKLPTRSFSIMKDGSEIGFKGVKMSVSLGELDDSSFTTLKSGQSVHLTHEVASLFDFKSAGAGTYTVQPHASFVAMGVNDDPATATFQRVVANANTLTVKVAGDLANRELHREKRAVDICGSPSEASFIDASYNEGQNLASVASNYVNTYFGTDSLYQAYFNNGDPNTVISVLDNVAFENSGSRTLDCSDPYGACSPGVIAYTVISTTDIYYCGIFFNEVPTSSLCTGTTVNSRSVRGGTTLHELTHATSGTSDVTYGCANDQALSTSNALQNADSYNCFATQVYQNLGCP
ncbi:hypothetical protein AX17_006498 [Amanita inopinata Kibby_2008]|nr:hypothetical protein AX17_006498 [Amanita inopinata Kibby_2008]